METENQYTCDFFTSDLKIHRETQSNKMEEKDPPQIEVKRQLG